MAAYDLWLKRDRIATCIQIASTIIPAAGGVFLMANFACRSRVFEGLGPGGGFIRLFSNPLLAGPSPSTALHWQRRTPKSRRPV